MIIWKKVLSTIGFNEHSNYVSYTNAEGHTVA